VGNLMFYVLFDTTQITIHIITYMSIKNRVM
jgi:hypothetical protein